MAKGDPVVRRVTVVFGPSRSKRFKKAVAEAQSGAGECRELEPGRYEVRFVLGHKTDAYAGLSRLLEQVRHWRATEVYEDEEKVSTFHAKDIKIVDCPFRGIGWQGRWEFGGGALRLFGGCVADLPWSAGCGRSRVCRLVGAVAGKGRPPGPGPGER